ncbi:MAG: MoaD/ThiS family protein [Dehalococcoidales bacterium]|nr:MoaD/ThiS family protein [Dehalococcoidales bacterium]
MFKCDVHIYGLPREVTELPAVEIELNEGAGMREVVSAMKNKIPNLEGPVIRPGENRLNERFKFNINGHFFYDGMNFELKPGDRIALLIPAQGG